MTARLDLHLHTTFSDGTLAPEALVAEAAARGVALIAITDHDEIGAIAPAQAAGAPLGVRVLSGVEINTEEGREEIHILGYGFPTDAPVLVEGLGALRRERLERLQKMLGRLRDLGYPLQETRVLELAGHGSVGRPHLARALLEAGFVTSVSEAFERLLNSRSPAYVPRRPFPPEQAIALIHQAGGLASLAHPGKLGDPPRIINRLRAAGLDALEAYHSDHDRRDTDAMLRWARQYRLLVTGGSDSHGLHGPHATQVGDISIPDAVGEALLKALG
jgi:predicted metal-dependent phosphoesterase TrpH